jgi:hypothetical protein
MKDSKSIIFYDKTATRIINNMMVSQTGGVHAVYGSKGTGKSFLFKNLNFISRQQNILVVNFEVQKIIDSNFLLHTFCNVLTNKLSFVSKEINKMNHDDLQEVKKILKMKFKTISDDEKKNYRKKLINYLIFLNDIIKLHEIKILFTYDNVDQLPIADMLKVLQLLRYVKNYADNINVFVFINQFNFTKKLNVNSLDEIKNEYFNSLISVDESWKHYELENKLIYDFIKNQKINDINLVLHLLRYRINAVKFINNFSYNYHKFNFIIQLANEIELINFVFNYLKETNEEVFATIMQSIIAFHLIKDEERFISVENRNEKNKTVFSKLRAIINYFETQKVTFPDHVNKFKFVCENIFFPYDLDWQILFTSKYDKDKLKEDNLNVYFPILISYLPLQFWAKKNEEYWFRIDEDVLPNELNVFIKIILEQKQLFNIVNINEKLIYYTALNDFLIFLTRTYLANVQL